MSSVGGQTMAISTSNPILHIVLSCRHTKGRCLMWGTRVVIPPLGQTGYCKNYVLEGHPRIPKMQALARMYVWWPGMMLKLRSLSEGVLSAIISTTTTFSINGGGPRDPNFATPFQGKKILVLIVAHSKWIEAVCTPLTSSASVIDEL